jgi:hypothetical protein
MRDDLQYAHAAVDWARNQLPILEQEFKSWFESSPYSIVEDLHPEMGSKFFKLQVHRKLPNITNAGVGAVINSIRTALDLLASALAVRNGAPNSNCSFPIYMTPEDFTDAKNVAQRTTWLSAAHRQIVDELKPYHGGNELLFALDQLDALRKRKRLIDIRLTPGATLHTPEAEAAGFRINPNWPSFEDGVVLGGSNIVSPISGFEVVVDIALGQTDLVATQPAIGTLGEFARLADDIIERFDTV